METQTPNAAGETPPEPDTVSTGEELLEWLSSHEDAGGTVKLAADIAIGDFSYVHGFRQPAITIDTGEFFITIDGSVDLQAGSPLTIQGLGGENGVLRSSKGGILYVNGLTLEAENGYAVFQEEGAGFLLENTSVSGEVHYADLPYVCEWKPVLVVEEGGESFDAGHLPAVLLARVNRRGQMSDRYEEVPVIWDLTGHEEDQELRRRFTVLGVFDGMASQKAPACTVVYDDYPLTFLEVKAKKAGEGRGESYSFIGTFSKPEDRLPIIIAQEYSFDGESWMLYEEKEVDNPNSAFVIYLSAGTGEQGSPNLFIRLSWNDAGTMYYSNVLCFAGDSLEESEDRGGNRGGGTDVVDPPDPPEPDPEPSPEASEPETVPPPEASEPETVPPPEASEPETVPPPEASEPEAVPPPEASEPETVPSQPGHNGTDNETGGGEGEAAPPEDSGGHGNTQEPSYSISKNPEVSVQVPSATEPASGQVSEPAQSQETAIPSTGGEGNTGSSSAETDMPSSSTPLAAEKAPEATLPVKQPDIPAVYDNITASSSSGKSPEVSAEPEKEPVVRRPDALSVAAGFTAIAVSIGGAALYLHPKAWKRLLGKLRGFIKR